MELENYFDNNAQEIRQAALDRFCDGFSATRRILSNRIINISLQDINKLPKFYNYYSKDL